MTSLAKRVLGSFLAATMLATPVAACAAEESAASETNTATANESTDSEAVVQTPEVAVQFIGIQDRAIDDARYIVANASHNKVAIVVWGGNRTIQQEAYNAALDLIDMGIPVAFVLGPDGNGLDTDAHMQIYAGSTPRADATYGTDFAHLVRADIRKGALAAHKEVFSQQVAGLAIR